MRALIVSTNRCREPVPVMPIGACMVAEAAERAGHDARVLDMMFARDPLAVLRRELDGFRPDVVGISARNIDNADMLAPVSQYDVLAPIVRTVRERSRAPVVIGGGAVSMMPGPLLRNCAADWAVLSDGDVAFPRLLDALSSGGDPRGVPGVGWLQDGVLASCPGAPACLMEPIPAPDFPRWIRVGPYLRRFASAPVQTKRGCPFECAYCTYPLIEGRDYRLFDPQLVLAAVRRLAAGGIRDIEFVDNVFNAPYEHALGVCEAVAGAGLHVRPQSVNVSPAGLDDRLLDAMERAGFCGIGAAAESAADAVLTGLRKTYTGAQVRAAAQAVRRHKVPCIWTFMFGGPGETQQTAQETLDFAESVLRPGDAVYFTVGVRIYPGTALEEAARRDGLLSGEPDDLLRPAFYVSPSVEARWLAERLRVTARRNRRFVQPLTRPGAVLRAARGMGYLMGLRPPLWKHAGWVRRVTG